MNVMDYENSKRFRRNKLEEDDITFHDNEMETKNGMKDLALKNSFSFDDELPEYDENNPTPTCFQDGTIYNNIITTEKYHYQFNYQKKIKTT